MDQTPIAHNTPGVTCRTSDFCPDRTTVPALVDRLNVNLLDPLTFAEWEYGNWIKRHRCGLCGSTLRPAFAPGRMWYAECPEHGAMCEGTYVNAGQAKRADQGMRNGLLEMWGK